MQFGEVRLEQVALMQQFGMTEDALPKVVAIRVNLDNSKQKVLYEGPNDFDKIREFLSDIAEGGPVVVELKKQVEVLQREAKGLKAELMHEHEKTSLAMAEAARTKLGQVGQVEAVRKELQFEIQQAREGEAAVKEEVEKLRKELEEKTRVLGEEKRSLEAQVQALKDVQQQQAMLLDSSNEQTFFASTLRPLRAVLFTTKSEIPQLWLDLAAQQSISCSFAVVRHTEEKLMQRFSLSPASLPRILLFSNKTDSPPIVYQGAIKLDSINTFIQDAVAGGTAATALRRQLKEKEEALERTEKELRAEKGRREREAEEAERKRREQVTGLESTVKSVQKQLRDACAGAQKELLQARGEGEERARQAEEVLEEVSRELVREREATQSKIQEALRRREEGIAKERKEWERGREGGEEMEAKLQLVERTCRTAEKAVLKAASAVHVSLVRAARDKERMHAALREFIDDVAPSHISTGAGAGGDRKSVV